jgi:hypothetical protein
MYKLLAASPPQLSHGVSQSGSSVQLVAALLGFLVSTACPSCLHHIANHKLCCVPVIGAVPCCRHAQQTTPSQPAQTQGRCHPSMPSKQELLKGKVRCAMLCQAVQRALCTLQDCAVRCACGWQVQSSGAAWWFNRNSLAGTIGCACGAALLRLCYLALPSLYIMQMVCKYAASET